MRQAVPRPANDVRFTLTAQEGWVWLWFVDWLAQLTQLLMKARTGANGNAALNKVV